MHWLYLIIKKYYFLRYAWLSHLAFGSDFRLFHIQFLNLPTPIWNKRPVLQIFASETRTHLWRCGALLR